MRREYHKWFSSSLGRDMELLLFGHTGAKVVVFPTREGRFYDYENWGLVNALRHSIAAGHIQLCCVDGLDSESLYCKRAPPEARIRRHNQFEQYILTEVIPLLRSQPGPQSFIAHGCSIGAYHAANLAFRHPALFCKVVALSGRFDLTKPAGPFSDLFEGYYDQDIYFHTPNHFVPSLTDSHYLEPLRRMEIRLAVGEADPFRTSNHQLSDALREKGVRHELAVWDGEAHRASAWRRMVPVYL